MDSLLRNMPVRESISPIRQNIINGINNDYPSFRSMPAEISYLDWRAYEENPDKLLYEEVRDLTMDDMVEFYENTVKPRPVVWFVVGNKKTLDLDKLSALGEIVEVGEKDIYRR